MNSVLVDSHRVELGIWSAIARRCHSEVAVGDGRICQRDRYRPLTGLARLSVDCQSDNRPLGPLRRRRRQGDVRDEADRHSAVMSPTLDDVAHYRWQILPSPTATSE